MDVTLAGAQVEFVGVLGGVLALIFIFIHHLLLLYWNYYHCIKFEYWVVKIKTYAYQKFDGKKGAFY